MSTRTHRISGANLFSTQLQKLCLLALGLGLAGILGGHAQTPSTVSKPPAGSQIDGKQPLAQGLVSAVPLNEGSGASFYDAATQKTYPALTLAGSPAGAQPPAWINPPKSDDYPWIGPAISNNNATAQAIQSTVQTQFIDTTTTGYSYAVLVEPLDPDTVERLGRIMDATGAAVITLYINIRESPGWSQPLGETPKTTPSSPLYKYTPNKWILVLCTVQDGLAVMYVNGVEVARSTEVNLAQSVAKQSGQLCYNTTGNGSMMCNANFSSWWVWNRVLTAKEAADLYVDPWAMFDRGSATH